MFGLWIDIKNNGLSQHKDGARINPVRYTYHTNAWQGESKLREGPCSLLRKHKHPLYFSLPLQVPNPTTPPRHHQNAGFQIRRRLLTVRPEPAFYHALLTNQHRMRNMP